MSMRRRRDRVSVKPRPEDWGDDEHLTLVEAVKVFWPDGPLTVTSLRTEIRHGRLTAETIAGKVLVTPQAIQEMRRRCRGRKKVRSSISESDNGERLFGSSSTTAADMKKIQALAKETFGALRMSLRTASPQNDLTSGSAKSELPSGSSLTMADMKKAQASLAAKLKARRETIKTNSPANAKSAPIARLPFRSA